MFNKATLISYIVYSQWLSNVKGMSRRKTKSEKKSTLSLLLGTISKQWTFAQLVNMDVVFSEYLK